MSADNIQQAIDQEAKGYSDRFESGELTLEVAHKLLMDGVQARSAVHGGLSLIRIAGLAKAIALVQYA